MDFILSIKPLAWGGLGSAVLSGAIIGIERQLLGKPVGIRTSMLICIGTYVFVVVSNQVINVSTDPSRIIGQIVTGIGFLGAGVMLTRDGVVVGVTSASAIWILASVGVLIGSGYYVTGIKISAISVGILVGIDNLESAFSGLQRGVHKIVQRRAKKSSE